MWSRTGHEVLISRGLIVLTHQAGLLVHEAVYATLRMLKTAITSLPARRITALLFSNLDDDNYTLKLLSDQIS